MAANPARHAPRLVTAATRAVLGESPVWDERTGTLYWVDIERGELHHCRADGSEQGLMRIGQRIGCVALRRDRPGFIAGLERSIALLTSNPLEIRPLAPLDAHLTGIRCNDGKCDAQGRFWIGTCDTAFHEATGWFFRFDAAGALMRTVGPFICTNGPAFSPDGTRIYCVDSYGKVVYQYAMSPTGDLGAPTVFQRFDREDWGYPDGLTCDLAGCVWIAHWGASKVSRFSPQGELLDVIHLPVAQPTSCTFGGPELKRLFITSASQGLSAASNANGLAGAVFAVDLEVGGLRAARFAG
ncbi:MAG TPA: SMP-30/gluconolactonase/LRE family protein [Steroidobacteraceae bacterium]